MIRQFIAAALCVFALGAATTATAQTGARTALTAKAIDLPAIQKSADAAGNVTAFIEFDVPDSQRLKANDNDQELMTAVKARQEGILRGAFGTVDENRIRTSGGRHVLRYQYSPLMLFSGSLADLDRLAAQPQVTRVIPDGENKLDLSSSRRVIGADIAHSGGFIGTGSYIAIIDSGVQRTHPFVAGRVFLDACFSNQGKDGKPSLCPNGRATQTGVGAAEPCTFVKCDHGMHVAGIVAGKAVTGSPGNGIAPGARIIPVNITTRGTAANTFKLYDSDIVRGLEYVYSKRTTLPAGWKLAAVNMSLGTDAVTTKACDTYVGAAIMKQLSTAGIPVVVASGNSSSKNGVSSPACVTVATSVSATTDTDQVASFANMGTLVDLLAPGQGIVSSVFGGAYGSKDGTSMAAPHVAGAIAVLRQAAVDGPNANFSANTAVTVLGRSGKAVKDMRSGGTITKPRIDLKAAMDDAFIKVPKLQLTAANTHIIGQLGGPFPTLTIRAKVSRGTHNFVLHGLPSWLKASKATGTVAAGAGTSIVLSVSKPAAPLQRVYVLDLTLSSDSALPTESLEIFVEVLPPGDNFENAIVVAGTDTKTGDNKEATLQTNEPRTDFQLNRSIWFRHTAPAQAGQLRIKTEGSLFDTVLGAYKGNTLAGLTRLGQNDDDGSADHLSTLAVRTQPGQVTSIQLGSRLGTLVGAGKYVVSTDWIAEPAGPGVTPSSNFVISGNQGGPFTPTSQTYHLGNFSFLPTTFAIDNLPAWATASPLTQTLAAAAGVDVVVEVKSDVAAALSAGTYNQTINFRNTATNVVFATRTLTLNVGSGSGSGDNDNFVNAIEVPGTGNTRTAAGTNATATTEAGEPEPGDVPINGSVWYKFTAAASESVTVETSGTIDSVLGVYTGSTVAGLAEKASDWGSGPSGSLLSFNAVSGTVYYIQVASLGGTARGAFTLDVRPTAGADRHAASRH